MVPKEREWLQGAISEEIDEEFEEAANLNDVVGQVDALADTIYFAIGGFIRMGVPHHKIEPILMAVHKANMEKKKGSKAERKVQSDLDATKPEGWVGPEEDIMRILIND
jgi:predicted HAD superfamily Cof-like phosphohydrolase